MNLQLERRLYRPDGIFSNLKDSNGKLIAATLEHAYDNGKGGFEPKVKAGIYDCVRHAPNRLPYETFMLENVPDFQGNPVTGILFHIGNFNKDSDGCILVGRSIAFLNGIKMVTASADTFEPFMKLQTNQNSFQLTVIG